MRRYGKFVALVVIVLGTLVWLALAGINESKTYYITVSELQAMQDKALDKRLRVAGDVEPNSIRRSADRVEFVLLQDNRRLKVVYTGRDPLPDTFKDRAQCLADGRLGRDGVFEAKRIQAKCASKYEAMPGGQPSANRQEPQRSS
ncbi:MAG TPA: cytochrome c maturation protein CcmE [Bryobacterales bacterium]|jgi:cytochrome c-type biogenesis protein CcmE|nr:cytochrome c maturation protein CcmE [Bryobacterales bacterium]